MTRPTSNRRSCQHCAWTYSGTEEDALAAWRTHLLIHPNQSGRCKVCGAETAARGRFANMCEEHRKPVAVIRSKTPIEVVALPEPDPEPQANGNGSVSLIELAKNLEIAQMNLKVAQRDYDFALADMREAVEAL